MQQDSTDKILQRMESQQLPDLSQMDKHWEDMRGLLATAAIGGKPVVSAMAKWMIAATVMCAVALFGWKKGWFSSSDNKAAQQLEIAKIIQPPVQQKTDSSFQSNFLSTFKFQPNFSVTAGVYAFSIPDTYRDSGNSRKITPAYKVPPVEKDNTPVNAIDAYANLTAEKQTEKMNGVLMQQFWSQVEKKPQQFVIDNRNDTQLQGAEGTSIKIPANAFPNAGDGEITIELTEFYDYGEMIANKLTTSSYQRQLVSDGMLRIKAMQNGKEVQMTGLKPMDVNMPRRDKNSDMQLFAGEWKNFVGGPQLNWIPMGQQQPYRYGFRDGRGNAVLHPYAIHKRWFSKKKVVKYSLDNDKSMSVSATKKLIEAAYENEIVVKVRRRSPAFLGVFNKKLPKEYYEYNYQLPPRYREFYARGYGYNTDEMKTADSIQDRYNFSVTTTGWINCDRFSDDRSPKVELTISGNKEEKVYCSYLVFKDMKSVLPGYAYNNKCTFYNIPGGKDVTLVTLGISHGKTICSMRDMKTKNGEVTGLQFVETDPADFKQRLMVLKW